MSRKIRSPFHIASSFPQLWFCITYSSIFFCFSASLSFWQFFKSPLHILFYFLHFDMLRHLKFNIQTTINNQFDLILNSVLGQLYKSFFFLLGSKMTLAPVCFSSFLHIFMISQSPDFFLLFCSTVKLLW